MKKVKTEKMVEIAVHALTWGYIFLSPLFFRGLETGTMDWDGYLQKAFLPLQSCIVFYLNYLWLVPHYFLGRKQRKVFVLINIALVATMFGVFELQMQFVRTCHEASGALVAKHGLRHMDERFFPPKPTVPMRIFFMLRTVLIFVLVVVGALTLSLSMKWNKSEEARRKAELGRTLAELENLKNQINPHFLLNTLNNIYALTTIDATKAQQAIQELSHMLRYILYENKAEHVALSKEVDFINTYMWLMKLRLPSSVDVRFRVDLPRNEHFEMAPLIFISLVENAFKHGISATKQSYIHIRLSLQNSRLTFRCENSNFPKGRSDKSPGGIGLQQVRSRLALAYPGRHEWHYGPTADGTRYVSEIEIDV